MEELTKYLATKGSMTFADFMREALYCPKLGFYERPRSRVGRSVANDFFTAEAIGPVFADLVVEAARNLVGDEAAKSALFVEIGAEPEGGNVFSHARPAFADGLAVGRGEAFPESGPVVVFSNELFDAQPFHRVVRKGGAWRECGVKIADGRAVEVVLDELSAPVAAMAGRFPEEAGEGWRIDLPLDAIDLMDEIAARENVIAVIAFDYGLDWNDIFCRRPAGTARAYRNQTLCDDILADPGMQDITCHVAWDGLENVLESRGFSNVATERQEAFFARRAMPGIEKILKRGDLSECGKLRELLHPMRMGEIFQVLSATRGKFVT